MTTHVRSRSAAAIAGALVLSSGAFGASKAYVVQGYDETWSGDWNLSALADTAESQVVGKGYTLVRQNSPTRQDVLDALNTADQPIFFFGGHGIKRSDGTFAAQLFLSDGEYVSAQDVIDNVPLARRQQYIVVVLQACGQLHSKWTEAFPNAVLWSHADAVAMGKTRYDQYWHGEDRITAKADRGFESGGLMPIDMLDPRIAAAVPLTYHAAVDGYTNEGSGNFARYEWAMTEPLATEFGAQRFNMSVGVSSGSLQELGGVVADDGRATGTHRGFSNPDFVLRFTDAAFGAALGNIDTLPDAFLSGQAWIENNLTGLSDDTLFFGAVAITFGYNAVPAPGSATLAGLALLVGAKRRRG
jgi:hypothetical protein